MDLHVEMKPALAEFSEDLSDPQISDLQNSAKAGCRFTRDPLAEASGNLLIPRGLRAQTLDL